MGQKTQEMLGNAPLFADQPQQEQSQEPQPSAGPAAPIHLPWQTIAPAVLAIAFWLTAILAISTKCTTYDEIAHITGGYTYWKLNDFRLVPDHGNLNERFLALPLLLLNPTLPKLDQPAWRTSDLFEYSWQFFYESGNNPDQLLFYSRSMMALLGAAVVVLVWMLTRKWFGVYGAVIAGLLCAFNPNMLAHGALATTDMSATLMFLVALLAAWKMLHRLGAKTVLGAGAALTVLFMTKLSAVLILPVLAILLVIRLINSQPLETAWPLRKPIAGRLGQFAILTAAFLVIGIVIWISIWTAYGFRYSMFHQPQSPDDRIAINSPEFRASEGWKGQVVTTAMNYRILPEGYLTGLRVIVHFSKRSGFLNGRYSDEGSWKFFPIAMAVKTPLPLFILMALGVLVTIKGWLHPRTVGPPSPLWRRIAGDFYAAAPLWAFLLVYGGVAVAGSMNIGIRHILPLHPMFFIFAGSAAGWIALRNRGITALIAGLLLWYVVEAMVIFPHYVAYFNQLIGGPSEGYRCLTDSSLDWGENLPLLKDWINSNQGRLKNRPIYYSYFGHGDPRFYKVDGIEFNGWGEFDRRGKLSIEPLRGGIYCISSFMLTLGRQWTPEREKQYQELRQIIEAMRQARQNPEQFRAFLAQRPENFWQQVIFFFTRLQGDRLSAYLWSCRPMHQIGYSIQVYDLSDQQVQEALLGPSP